MKPLESSVGDASGLLPASPSIDRTGTGLEPSLDHPPRFGAENERTTERLLAEAGWLSTLNRLLARVSHDLSGGAMFLDTEARRLEGGQRPSGMLRSEVERVWTLSEHLTLLQVAPDARAAACTAEAALAPALRLYALLHDSPGGPPTAEIPAGLPPLLVLESRFRRSLVLFLEAAGPPRSGGPSLSVSEGPDRLEIRVPGSAEGLGGPRGRALADLFALDLAELLTDGTDGVVRLAYGTRDRY